MINRALRLLGCEKISALGEGSTNSVAAEAAYDQVLEDCHEDHDWLFARKQASISADATPPAWGKANRFAKPADFLRLEGPFDADNSIDRDWEIIGDYIHTDEAAPLRFIYIASVADPSKWHPLFRKFFAYALAIELAPLLVNSNTQVQTLEQQQEKVLQKAKRTSAIQRIPRTRPEPRIILVRR